MRDGKDYHSHAKTYIPRIYIAYVSVNKNGNLYLIQLQNSKIKPLLWMARAIKEIPFARSRVA